MKGEAIDWSSVCWRYNNRSLARLLNVTTYAVSRMRTVHAPDGMRMFRTAVGVGAKVERSGAAAPELHMRTADLCRQLVAELSAGAPTGETINKLRQQLGFLELERLAPREGETP